MSRAVALFAFGALAASCSDLKTAPANERLGNEPDAGAPPPSPPHEMDGGHPRAPDGAAPGVSSGPGAFGALPSGYCCESDADCRDRRCLPDGAGGHACVDRCMSEAMCQRGDIQFTCGPPDEDRRRLCVPPPGFRCVAASSFVRGARPAGACCTATGDGRNGEECDGNLCISISPAGQETPFFCSRACVRTEECGRGFRCEPTPLDERRVCTPVALPYDCNVAATSGGGAPP